MRSCDEINVLYKDKDIIYDLVEKYPDKTIILEIAPKEEYDINKIRELNIICKYKLICRVPSFDVIKDCKNLNIAFFYGFPVYNYSTLQSLKNLGAKYIILEAPLFFDLNIVKNFNVPVRAVPNRITTEDFPIVSSHGTWIRPEDVEVYEKYIDVFEFYFEDTKQEHALFRIYHNEQKCVGRLSLLWRKNKIEEDARSSMLPRELTYRRLNCKHHCAINGFNCRSCDRAFGLANPEVIKEYLAARSEN